MEIKSKCRDEKCISADIKNQITIALTDIILKCDLSNTGNTKKLKWDLSITSQIYQNYK